MAQRQEKEERKLVENLLGGLFGFLNEIEELQKKTEASETKEFTAESGKKAIFHYDVNIHKGEHHGVRPRFGMRPGARVHQIHQRKVIGNEAGKEVVAPEPVYKEHHFDVFDRDDKIVVVLELPDIKERDIDFTLEKNTLKISAKTKQGDVKNEISIPENSRIKKIENVSFKNGIFEITLKKAKANKE
ncbi:Hsp20/alpha crystallin family protein [Candidatus Woesearchaeota archaeon]|nr:Hsp20/alpha crystallin family protein [Candidatus Woesearchaeota archaeon]